MDNDRGGGEVRRKFLSFAVEKSAKTDEKNPNVRTFRGTTVDNDRDGDVLHPEGAQVDNYLKNPIFLYGHDWHERLPIGRALDVRVEQRNVDFDIEFDSGDPFAMDVMRKFDGGFLNAVSVGFIPTDFELIRDEESNNITGLDFKEWELLELSAVTVPANPDALQLAYSKFLAMEKALELGVEGDGEDDQSSDEKSEDDDPGDEFVTSKYFGEVIGELKDAIQSLHDMIEKGASTASEGGESSDEDRLRKGLDEMGLSEEQAVALLSERSLTADQSESAEAKKVRLASVIQSEVTKQVAYKAGRAWTLKENSGRR